MAMTEQQVQLVIAAQNGDIKSFEQLYAIFYEKVYGFARMILKNERDAEDVLQETFITAWRKLNMLENLPTFSIWIQIIAKNLCNMQLRRKNMAILLDAEQDIENFDMAEESEETLPAVYAERADLKERLGNIIDGLSDVQRQTIVLYYFNELSVDEISEIMECSPGTVKSRLFLARNTIRTEVEEQERKTGQKFYGMAGLPMLPLGKLIQSHMASLSIGQSAANVSLSAITNSISNVNPTGAAATAAKIKKTKLEGTKMAKKLSLKAKIMAGISAIAALGTVAVLVVILATGGGKNSPTSGDLLDFDWSSLNGYWTSDDKFVGFFYEEDGFNFEYGLYQSSYWFGGEITDIVVTGENTMALTLHIPATPATEMDGAKPERTETVYIDLSNFNDDHRLNIKIENLGRGEWYTYEYGGPTLGEAYDLSGAIANLPGNAALDAIWNRLDGYWYVLSDHGAYLGFFTDESGAHFFEYGLFETEFGERGEVTDTVATGQYEVTLTVHFPAVPPNEVHSGWAEHTDTIKIDLSDLFQNGIIKVSTQIQIVGGWYDYAYGGMTLQEAYQNWAG